MNIHYETIRAFRMKDFAVVVDACPDYDAELSFDEDGSVREALESGRLMSFQVRARALYKGNELAADYLGGCIYKSLQEFMDHKECGRYNKELEAKGETGRCGSYFSDMIKTVCQEARKELLSLKAARVRAA